MGTNEVGRSLERQPVGQPVHLAAAVVGCVGEAERLEPPRGPRAHVSEEVVAVDDDGPVGVERLCPGVDLAQGHVTGTGKVGPVELGFVESISPETIRQLLKKTNSNPGNTSSGASQL